MDKANRKIITFLIIATLWSMIVIGVISYLESMGFEDWLMKLTIVILAYGLPMFVTFKVFNKKHVLSNRQITGLFLALLALPIFGYALFGTKIPTIESSNSYKEFITFNDNQTSSNLTASFWTIMDFNTVGSFSAENPIHVKVTVFDSNVTDLTHYIGMVSFTGSNPVISGNNANVKSGVGYLNLTQTDNGMYKAEGDLIWYQDIFSHSAWLPPNTAYYDQGYWQQIGQGKLDISPAADTLAFRSSHTMEQLTYVLVGFSVIMLQPIFEAIFPDKSTKAEEDSPPS
ncbi:MAG: hypothetical protein ABSB71_03295 [Candidatus Bathyarchaeia archaeon]